MIYTPDKWIITRLTSENGTHYRVFGCWYGGYAGSDSWKFNSGITKVTLDNGIYKFEGTSGSEYHCYQHNYGTSGYGHGVLNSLINDSKPMVLIEPLDEDTDFLTLDYTT